MTMTILIGCFFARQIAIVWDNQTVYRLVTTKDLRQSVLCYRANNKFNGMCIHVSFYPWKTVIWLRIDITSWNRKDFNKSSEKQLSYTYQ